MPQQWDVLIDDPSYRSFMVRLWRAPARTEQLWHCEVEDIQSGEIVEVSSLAEILSLIGQIVKRDVEKSL
jgi:hypothetical protein